MKFERPEIILDQTTESLSEEPVFRMSKEEKTQQEQILETFTPEQQAQIEHKRKILSSLAYFIGKDFQIPVELNTPGAGWHWDFEHNIIRIDPKDLMEKPMDYLRFVIAHEGGHRRISRTDFIPVEEWRQPGFSFMMNAIEDPRMNNFVAENYPKFKEQMKLAYTLHEEEEVSAKAEAKDKLGYQPRFMQAGFQYIRQWFREVQGNKFELPTDLPSEVREVLEKTLTSAQDSWWRYPTKKEADRSEQKIHDYAKVSYEINRDEIWPEFKKLVEKDKEDQRSQEFLKNQQKNQSGDSGGQGLPQEFTDMLTPEEQKSLGEAIDKAIEKNKEKQSQSAKTEDNASLKVDGQPSDNQGESQDSSKTEGKESEQNKSEGDNGVELVGSPVDLDSLSPELKQKIKDYIDSLPEDQKKELAEKAEKSIKEFETEVAKELQGKLNQNPEEQTQEEREAERAMMSAGAPVRKGKSRKGVVDYEGLKLYQERLEREINKDANLYEEMRREVLPIIDKLEMELRQIFVERKTRSWKTGFDTGKRIDIKTRIQEKARSVPAMESRAWQKREAPQEKDYAISLLVDLSGSMWENDRIQETFKSVVVLCEVLNRLSINLEILGFNDQMYRYQDFGEQLSNKIREIMGGMIQEVDDSRCKSCGTEHNETDLGWATEQASESLAHQKADNKFLITLSDGKIAESNKHPRAKYNLKEIIKKVVDKSDVRVIGLGVGRGTGAMSDYYPTGVVNVEVKEMADKLAELIRDVVEDYDKI